MSALTPAALAGASTNVGYAEYNLMLAAVRAGLFGQFLLGGDDENGHPGSTYVAILKSTPIVIPSSVELAGTWKLRVFLRCEDSSVTITTKLRDLTSAADVGSSTSSACSGTSSDYSGTNQHQLSSALTLTAGHIYQVQAIKSALTKQCWVDAAYLQRTDS